MRITSLSLINSSRVPCVFEQTPSTGLHQHAALKLEQLPAAGVCGCSWSFGSHDCALRCNGLGSSILGEHNILLRDTSFIDGPALLSMCTRTQPAWVPVNIEDVLQ